MLTLIILAILAVPVVLLAQQDPEVPDFFSQFFSPELVGAVTTTIAASKVFRNVFSGIKGVPAFILTLLVSIMVGEFSFYQSQGWFFAGLAGLGAGLVSAGAFKVSKLFGAIFKKTKVGQKVAALPKQ